MKKKKKTDSMLDFRLGFGVYATRPKLTLSSPISAESRLRKEVFGCFYTHCGSNLEESEQERSISRNLHKTIKNVEH